MPFKSPHSIELPQTDLITYLFPPNADDLDNPIWLDAANPSSFVSKRQALSYIKRLAAGLKRIGVQKGDIVLMLSPNHIFVPICYLGVIASGAIFSGANTSCVAAGKLTCIPLCYFKSWYKSRAQTSNWEHGREGLVVPPDFIRACTRSFCASRISKKTDFPLFRLWHCCSS